MILDESKIEDQAYLQAQLVKANNSDENIIDISIFSETNKKHVIKAFNKFKFALNQSKSAINVSILTHKNTPVLVHTNPVEINDFIEIEIEEIKDVVDEVTEEVVEPIKRRVKK